MPPSSSRGSSESSQRTKIDLTQAEAPPRFVEIFTFSMDSRTMVVTAVRPNGEKVSSETKTVGMIRRQKVATHTLDWKGVVERSLTSRNAYEFIWRINRTGIR